MTKSEAQARGWVFYTDQEPLVATLGPEPRVQRFGSSTDELLASIEAWEGEHATRKPEARHPAVKD